MDYNRIFDVVTVLRFAEDTRNLFGGMWTLASWLSNPKSSQGAMRVTRSLAPKHSDPNILYPTPTYHLVGRLLYSKY